MNDLPERFDHATREPEIYASWLEYGAFQPNRDSAKESYYIAMPPPNVTGALHLGHALTFTIEDVMIRWRRMAGYAVLWLPGTDHASTATERLVIRKLEKGTLEPEKKPPIYNPRKTLGRSGLVERIEGYVDKRRLEIRSQITALGASCDWSRERYTLDAAFKRAVSETFGQMFHDGLIYRGNRIVNWDFDFATTLSEGEIYSEERESPLYFIQYKHQDLDLKLRVATFRPEMRLGDTALAVHPEDEKYKKYIGKEIKGRWPKGPSFRVKIIADSVVDRYFGLGVVGVTPAHDPNDFELAKRHGLPFVKVIGDDGRMTAAAGPYRDMTPQKCREAFVRDLAEAQLLIQGKQGHKQHVRFSSRGGTPVEYLPKEQWFVDVNCPAIQWNGQKRSLRDVMEDVVRSGGIDFLQDNQRDIYLSWISKLRDWCISRQGWWGHPVPVWYRGGREVYVGARPPGEGWSQDRDTLDTWFSSAMWSWATLIDPAAAEDETLTLDEILARSPDYQRFHPMSVVETGHDILFFWVARMILMTTYVTGQVPFKKIYLHGLVLDDENDRMSTARQEHCKDPGTVIAERGADALRLALVGRTSTAVNVRLTDEKVDIGGRFVHKLWNAARYVMRRGDFDGLPAQVPIHPLNRWMMSRLGTMAEKVTVALEAFKVGDAAKISQEAFREDFCDFYIEAAKTTAMSENDETRQVLAHSFLTYLCVLHPFIPFVTEELWSYAGKPGLLMLQPWPDTTTQKTVGAEDSDVLFELVEWIRQKRGRAKLPWKVPLNLRIWTSNDRPLLESCASLLTEMVNASSIEFTESEIDGDEVLDRRLIVAVTQASELR